MSPEHSIDIFLGLDVGKSEHHACALDRDGNKVFDKPLPQLESELAGVFHQLQKLGTCLLYTSPSPRDATLSRMPSSA